MYANSCKIFDAECWIILQTSRYHREVSVEREVAEGQHYSGEVERGSGSEAHHLDRSRKRNIL